MYAEVVKIYDKNETSIHKIMKKRKEIHASFSVTSQNAKVTATVCDKCLVKIEKSIKGIRYFERERETTFT